MTLRELILTDEAAAMEILRAIAKGESTQWCEPSHESWYALFGTPTVMLDVIYRVAPQPSTVDWSHVGENIVAFITQPSGRSWGFSKIPEENKRHWFSYSTQIPADYWPSFKPGNMPWQESLIIRPGKEQS